MSEYGLTRENLLAALPAALREDSAVAALAEAAAELLARRPGEIDHLRIYPAIGRLGESLLDILAQDFKVDWWDADYSLEEKRQTLADSWRVHQLLGTKAAVETAISAIYPEAKVWEWFEYEGGEPYHFKLRIDISKEKGNRSKPLQVLEKAVFYKNLRSHLDVIEYLVNAPVMERPIFAAPCQGGMSACTRLPKRDPPLAPARLFAAPGFAGHTEIRPLPVRSPPFGGCRTAAACPLLGGSFASVRLPLALRPVGLRTAVRTGGSLSVTELPEVREERR